MYASGFRVRTASVVTGARGPPVCTFGASARTTSRAIESLNVKHVLQLAIVDLRPQCVTVLRSDELHGDPESISLLAHTALKNVFDSQSFADRARIVVPAFECENRSGAHHAQSRRHCQCADQLMRNAIGKISHVSCGT